MMKRWMLLFLVGSPAMAADFQASLDWSQRVTLALPVSGVVAMVSAQPGETVAKGRVLASLDGRAYEAGVLEARADLDRLSREAGDADKELERARELYARTVTSTTELDAAQLRQARATALLTAAQARVEKARKALEDSEARAPFDAVILDRLAEPGMVTSQCQPAPLLTLARADEMIARAELTVAQAGGIPLQRPALVQTGGRQYSGAVRAIRALANGRYALEVAFPRPSGLLAGMEARIRLP